MVNIPMGEKVILLGKMYSGKTCLAQRILRNLSWCDRKYEATIGSAFGEKYITLGNYTIKIGLWDTAGAERYEAMSRMYYRDSKAAIICYDVTDISSYERAVAWCKELNEVEQGCLMYLCGTKKDLVEGELKNHRKIDYHDAREFAEELNAKFYETSSKTGENIDELIHQIAEDLLARKRLLKQIEPDNVFLVEDKPIKKFKCSACYKS